MSEILFAVAVAGFVVVGAWLAHVDILEHRLPNRIVVPAAVGLVALCAFASATEGSAGLLARAVGGALIHGSFYLLLRAASRNSLGGGDVKLSVPVGLLLAWDGWAALAAGAVLAFIVGGVWAVGTIATGHGSRSTHIAFGPCMVLGAVIGLVVT